SRRRAWPYEPGRSTPRRAVPDRFGRRPPPVERPAPRSPRRRRRPRAPEAPGPGRPGTLRPVRRGTDRGLTPPAGPASRRSGPAPRTPAAGAAPPPGRPAAATPRRGTPPLPTPARRRSPRAAAPATPTVAPVVRAVRAQTTTTTGGADSGPSVGPRRRRAARRSQSVNGCGQLGHQLPQRRDLAFPPRVTISPEPVSALVEELLGLVEDGPPPVQHPCSCRPPCHAPPPVGPATDIQQMLNPVATVRPSSSPVKSWTPNPGAAFGTRTRTSRREHTGQGTCRTRVVPTLVAHPMRKVPLVRTLPTAISSREAVIAETFAARGFEDTRMEDLAEATGVPKATLYYHFAGKEEILA